MAQFTEEEKTIRRIEKRFSKGLVEYGLIEDGDKILIGLSGGKDSLALVELLAKRARVFKPRFSVVAVHVVMKNIPYQSDLAYLREYVESWNIPFDCMRRSSMQVRIRVSHLVFFVHGIGVKRCLLLPRNKVVIK